MHAGKITIILAVITMIGGWGTALITNWDKITSQDKAPKLEAINTYEVELQNKIEKLNQVLKELQETKGQVKSQSSQLDSKNKQIEELKNEFNNINNSKLKELLKFHNDAVCYGRSLNFTHEADESYNHCEPKEALAKRFLKFFEELEIIESNGGMDYSRTKAKNELIKLQSIYNFTNPGWYTEFMLGILIIEYAKKG